jgi:hypothetical protein
VSDNLFDSAYRRLAVVDNPQPCYLDGCTALATGNEPRLHLSLTRVDAVEERIHLYCDEHAQDARSDLREARAILQERDRDVATGYWLGIRERRGFDADFDLNNCDDAEHAARWQSYVARLGPFVDWRSESCHRSDCTRLAEVVAHRLAVTMEYDSWARVPRWYCTPHARTAERHATEAEAALAHYSAAIEASDEVEMEALTAACTVVLTRTRVFIPDWQTAG